MDRKTKFTCRSYIPTSQWHSPSRQQITSHHVTVCYLTIKAVTSIIRWMWMYPRHIRDTYVAVPDRNQILVHRVFRAHQRVQRATALSFRSGRGSYALRGRIRYSCIYIARMSPTLSGSSALQHVKLGDALKIRNGIIFDFYSGLPHM